MKDVALRLRWIGALAGLALVAGQLANASQFASGSTSEVSAAGGQSVTVAEVANLVPSDVDARVGDANSVSIDTDTIVVGAWFPGPGHKGAAYVFRRNSGAAGGWLEVAKLTPSDVDATFFGQAVSIGGDVIGVHAFDDGTGNSAGVVYLFERNAGGIEAWGETAKLTAPDGAALFGTSLAIDGGTLVVGSLSEAAYVYEQDPHTRIWVETQILAPSSGNDLGFGNAVSIDGDRIAVSAHAFAGAVYVFQQDAGGATGWQEVGRAMSPIGDLGDGMAVSIAGERVLTGAFFDYDNFNGLAFIFERGTPDSPAWGLDATLASCGADDLFGVAVSLSEKFALVGAPFGDPDLETHPGAPGSASLYQRDLGGEGNWGEVVRLDGDQQDGMFGAAVALDQSTFVVSHPGAPPRGRVHVYEISPGRPGFNGEFSSGRLRPWRLHSNDWNALGVIQHGALEINVGPGGSDVISQLLQKDLFLEGDTTYVVRFDASSSFGSNLRVRVLQHLAPFENYGLARSVNIRQQTRTFEIEFTTTPGDKHDARLSFLLQFRDRNGFAMPHEVYRFDNISLLRLGQCDASATPAAGGARPDMQRRTFEESFPAELVLDVWR